MKRFGKWIVAPPAARGQATGVALAGNTVLRRELPPTAVHVGELGQGDSAQRIACCLSSRPEGAATNGDGEANG